jgi:hypothetical protein
MNQQQNDLQAQLRLQELTVDCFATRQVAAGHKLAGVGAKCLAALLAVDSNWAGVRDPGNVALVDARRDMPGLIDRGIARVVQLPLYFSEVLEYKPLSTHDLAKRAVFAESTGYLVVCAAECLGVEWTTTKNERWRLFDAWEYEGAGKLRRVNEAQNPDRECKQRSIAHLHVNEAQRVLTELTISHVTALADGFITRAGRLHQSIERLREHVPVAPPERTASGAELERFFIEDGDTGKAFAYLAPSSAWVGYPTSQDAWYYAQFINSEMRQTVCYAEGDLTRVTCETFR